MRYAVSLKKTDEGYSVSVPGLPGCWSQGETEGEALRNIEQATLDYLAVARQLAEGAELREIEIAV
jgi:predicted RNase H-like HicB family nuclease